MTRRDLVWRGVGLGLIAVGYTLGITARMAMADPRSSLESVAAILGFVAVIAGLALAVKGKRVPMAFRIERGRHRALPLAIGARRRRRHEEGGASVRCEGT